MEQRRITPRPGGSALREDGMAVDFRGHPMFPTSGFSAPTRFEADVYDCEIWGELPSDIDGSF